MSNPDRPVGLVLNAICVMHTLFVGLVTDLIYLWHKSSLVSISKINKRKCFKWKQIMIKRINLKSVMIVPKAEWEANDPVLSIGNLMMEKGTTKSKLSDGVHTWS